MRTSVSDMVFIPLLTFADSVMIMRLQLEHKIPAKTPVGRFWDLDCFANPDLLFPCETPCNKASQSAQRNLACFLSFVIMFVPFVERRKERKARRSDLLGIFVHRVFSVLSVILFFVSSVIPVEDRVYNQADEERAQHVIPKPIEFFPDQVDWKKGG